jgi:hypothetical protein
MYKRGVSAAAAVVSRAGGAHIFVTDAGSGGKQMVDKTRKWTPRLSAVLSASSVRFRPTCLEANTD